MQANKWSDDENDIVIDAYFDMLQREQSGRPFVKADVNRRVQRLLPGRGRSSIEYKFQNISAVLDDANLPYVVGYKPARNYQQSLRDLVLARTSDT